MNRKERREQAKENRKNSKKNFASGGYKDISIDEIEHDPNLKECDPELLDLIQQRFDWQQNGLISNRRAMQLIVYGCSYLDSLCSLRFDITPSDDKTLVRDTMCYVANFTNFFLGMMGDKKFGDKTLYEHGKDGSVMSPVVQDLYPSKGLPNKEIMDDVYASYVSEHAHELTSLLQYTRKSDIEGDEKYVKKVLYMVLKKTSELLQEAQVDSEKFIVQ